MYHTYSIRIDLATREPYTITRKTSCPFDIESFLEEQRASPSNAIKAVRTYRDGKELSAEELGEECRIHISNGSVFGSATCPVFFGDLKQRFVREAEKIAAFLDKYGTNPVSA